MKNSNQTKVLEQKNSTVKVGIGRQELQLINP